jgi:gliding motility-associated-like protein
MLYLYLYMAINKIKQQLLFTFAFTLYLFFGYAQPEPCIGTPAMTSTCLDACVICDIDGFTGTNNLSIQGQTFPGFCTTQYHNMSYIAFIAGTEDLTLEVVVTNCTINWGLEIGIFESFDCETFVPVTPCNTDVQPNSTATFSNLSPLVVGQHYYLIMDGSAGDICDWTFNVLEGSTAVLELTTSGVISGNSEICPDLPTPYSTTGDVGAAIFYWTVDGIPQSNQNQEIDISFPTDGTYEVCVTAANVCDQAPPTCTSVNVVTLETLIIDEILCDNNCLEVAGEILCETGSYEYVIPLPNGCDSLIFVDLFILPQAEAFIDINLCAGEEFYIGNTPYSSTGIFMDTIQTLMECDSIVTLDLFIIECEIIGSTDFISPICHGDANGFLVFSVENGTPPFTYDWSNILDPNIGGVGSTILFTDNMIAGVPAGIYEINIQDGFGNDVVMFQEVIEPSTLTVTPEAIDIEGFNLSCNEGDDGIATATGNGGVPPYSFVWSNMQSSAQINNLVAGLYTVSITDSNGCIQTNSIQLIEPSPIQFEVNYIDPNCDGYETGIIQLDSIWGGTPPYSYALSGDTFNLISSYQDLSAGTYTFSIMDDNKCLVDTASELFAPDIPLLFLDDQLEVNLGCDVQIYTATNNTNLVNIQWSNSATLDCDTCLRPYAFPLEDSEYFITVTSIDTCTARDSVVIKVIKVRDIFVPNIFSPNGDGLNDFFFVNANKSVASIKTMKVFSRWGGLVYSGNNLPPNDISSGWDGNFNGKPLPQGVYVWIAEIEYLDGEVLIATGDVSLVL